MIRPEGQEEAVLSTPTIQDQTCCLVSPCALTREHVDLTSPQLEDHQEGHNACGFVELGGEDHVVREDVSEPTCTMCDDAVQLGWGLPERSVTCYK